MTKPNLAIGSRGTRAARTGSHLSLADIRAILFDLDGTLRHRHPSFNQAVFSFAAACGVSESAEKRRQALRWAHYYFARSPEIIKDVQELGSDRDIFLANYVRRYLTVYGCTPDRAAEFAPAIYSRMKATLQPKDCVDPSTPDTLEKLKRAGLTLGVVSNRLESFDDLLASLGLGRYFDFTLAAGQVDSWKPDKAIFHRAVQRAGTHPACTIHVGDNYYADVIGAQRAGIQPVLLDPDGLFPEAECPVIVSLAELQQGLT